MRTGNLYIVKCDVAMELVESTGYTDALRE
jgi:hypothetical protein